MKGSCVHCGGHIEFDDAQAGEVAECPHCGKSTVLRAMVAVNAPLEASAQPKRNRHWKLVFAFTAVMLFVLFYAWQPVAARSAIAFAFCLSFLAFLLWIYFLPTFFAHKFKNRNSQAIFILNFFLGWTLIGWVVAAVWAHRRDASGHYG